MSSLEQIQQHIEQLPNELQAEVFEFVLALEKKHQQQLEENALAIHEQLMNQYAEAFEKLAQ